MKRFLFFLAMSLSLTVGNSQVTGKVQDANTGEALVGATLIIKNTQIGTISGSDGVFKINASANNTLIITYVGYKTKEILISGNNEEIQIGLEELTTSLDQVVVLGTRSKGRVSMETPVPVDVVNLNQVTSNTARMDLTSILNIAAPSLNYNKQSGSDGADHIDLASLRGLGPDQSLVLINGKRRHQTAFISVFGTRGRGNSGTDLNAIPAAAIERVEILRDGASAQYGSDAIAGVMNLVLRQNSGLGINIGYSGYSDSEFNPAFKPELNQYEYENKWDGAQLMVDLNYGNKLGNKGGFYNLTGTFVTSDKTYRQSLDQDFNATYGLPVNIYRRAHGDGSLNGFGAYLNAELPVTDHTRLYANGGYNYKKSDAFAFTRNFSAKKQRFVTDSNFVLINSDLIRNSDSTETAGKDQYFNPHIQTEVTDFAGTVGIRGDLKSGWDWDLSNVIGKNDFHFFGDKTFNASSNDVNKNHFDDGGFSFLQNTTNLNFSKSFDNILSGFNLGTGVEFRYENYQLYAGEEASYKNFSPNKFFLDDDGNKVFVAGGAQGFPGYQPSDEADENRSAIGAYVDAELDITDKWLLGGAVRLENYSDFGFTHNYKLASRYKICNQFNLRGSVSTGFRAPSLQQINFSSTFTTVQGGNISEVKIAPNQNAITIAAGIPELKEEKSVNASLGFTYRPISEFNITVDLYNVQVKDRIVLSGQFDASDATLNPDLTNALNNLKVSLAQFFSNAVNTTNTGVDVVLDYNKKFGVQRLRLMATANFQKMTLDKINTPAKLNDTESHRKQFFSDRERAFLIASAPKSKMSFNADYGYKKFGIGARFSQFGEITILGYGEDGLGISPTVPTDDGSGSVPDEYVYGTKWVTDLYLSYKISNQISINIGADNLFSIHPDLGAVKNAKWWAFNNETGGPWDAVQMGGNGLHLFGRVGFNF